MYDDLRITPPIRATLAAMRAQPSLGRVIALIELALTPCAPASKKRSSPSVPVMLMASFITGVGLEFESYCRQRPGQSLLKRHSDDRARGGHGKFRGQYCGDE